MTVRYYSSTAPSKTLTVNITSSSTVITLSDVIGLPGLFPYTLALDYGQVSEELVEVSSGAGLSLTIARAIDGTSATSHGIGAVVRHVSSARDFTDSRTHENSTSNVHGVGGGAALVGTTTAQTLTNKTLGNPTINDATISGTIAGSATFSGVALHTGGDNFINPTGTVAVVAVRLTADPGARLAIRADGTVRWGDGASLTDTNLYRVSAGLLATDGRLRTGQGLDILTTAADTIQFKGATTATGGIVTRWRDSSNTSIAQINDLGAAQFGSVAANNVSTTVIKTANTTRTSTTTLADDPDLTASLVAGSYKFRAFLSCIGAALGAGDIKLGFGYTGTITQGTWQGHGTATSAATSFQNVGRSIDGGSQPFGINSGSFTGIVVEGTIIVSTSGTLALTWAQNTSSGTGTTVRQGSSLEWTRVA